MMAVLKAWNQATSQWEPVGTDGMEPISRTLIDAKGDLIVGSAADTASKLTAGADYSFLQALASESTGLTWGPSIQTWTPSITGFTQGNGTTSGSYYRIGPLIFFTCRFTLGSTSVAASAGVEFSMPVPVGFGFYAKATLFDSSSSITYEVAGNLEPSTEKAYAYMISTTTHGWAYFTTSTPFVWATNDRVDIYGLYAAE